LINGIRRKPRRRIKGNAGLILVGFGKGKIGEIRGEKWEI